MNTNLANYLNLGAPHRPSYFIVNEEETLFMFSFMQQNNEYTEIQNLSSIIAKIM